MRGRSSPDTIEETSIIAVQLRIFFRGKSKEDRSLPFENIATDRLAKFSLIGGQIKEIVPDLKRDPKMMREPAHWFDVFATASYRTQNGGKLQYFRRLEVDHGKIFL